MSVDLIARLEELVDRLLSERAELARRNRVLSSELDRLRADRDRARAELGTIIAKLDNVERRGA